MSASPYTLADIQTQLQQHFPHAQVSAADESAAHAGHSGNPDGDAISHIRVMLRSTHFAGLNKVAQHRAVHTALAPFYSLGLHAVVLDIAAT
jgi:BolA protein